MIEEKQTDEEALHAGGYGQAWDAYVDTVFPDLNDIDGGPYEWPGDEWGTPHEWQAVFDTLFVPARVADWQRAVEIGPGSGKYTLKALSASSATIRAYDVSPRYLMVCERRCAEAIGQGRLSLHLLGSERPDQMLRELETADWRGKLDALFSIDAMVHVDLQLLMVYMITAALALKPGGKLLLTLADATSDGGFRLLLDEIWLEYTNQDRPQKTYSFAWLSPQLVRQTLERLGFQVMLSRNDRDLFVIATLAHPERAAPLETFLTAPELRAPAGPDPRSQGSVPSEIAARDEQIRHLSAEIAALRSSYSWRLTTPLRALLTLQSLPWQRQR